MAQRRAPFRDSSGRPLTARPYRHLREKIACKTRTSLSQAKAQSQSLALMRLREALVPIQTVEESHRLSQQSRLNACFPRNSRKLATHSKIATNESGQLRPRSEELRSSGALSLPMAHTTRRSFYPLGGLSCAPSKNSLSGCIYGIFSIIWSELRSNSLCQKPRSKTIS